MISALLDKLIDLGYGLGEMILTLVSPCLCSKTGHQNPSVRNITSETYFLHGIWMIKGNITKWLESRADLFPEVLQLQTINRCNGQCGMCPYPYTIHLQPREVMEDALYSKIVRECASEPDFRQLVPMSKNEPLLDTKLEARIAEFKALAQPHQWVEIVTNGTALTRARFEALVASGLDLVTISLSALTEATYTRVMQGLSWSHLMRNLEALLASPARQRVNVFLRYVTQVENTSEFSVFKKHWKKRGLNIAHYHINNRSGSVRDYDRRLPPLSRLSERLRRGAGRRFFKHLCPHGFSIMHILQNGDVPMCANDWHNREILGNVNQTSIRAIYNSPRMKEIRALMAQGRYAEIPACQDCSFWKEWL